MLKGHGSASSVQSDTESTNSVVYAYCTFVCLCLSSNFESGWDERGCNQTLIHNKMSLTKEDHRSDLVFRLTKTHNVRLFSARYKFTQEIHFFEYILEI